MCHLSPEAKSGNQPKISSGALLALAYVLVSWLEGISKGSPGTRVLAGTLA